MIDSGNGRARRVDVAHFDFGLSARIGDRLVYVSDRFFKTNPQRVCRAAEAFADYIAGSISDYRVCLRASAINSKKIFFSW
jgi:hypothetical protein